MSALSGDGGASQTSGSDRTAPATSSLAPVERDGGEAAAPRQTKLTDEQMAKLKSFRSPRVNKFAPMFPRPAPPSLEVDGSELVFLAPYEPRRASAADGGDGDDGTLRRLLSRAFAAPLAPAAQQATLDAVLSVDVALVHHVLTPAQLPELVEQNPMIAIECLLKLMPCPELPEYLSALVNMDMCFLRQRLSVGPLRVGPLATARRCRSLHSMEVVNRLTTDESATLPKEFRPGPTSAFGVRD